ncbi:MAG: carboxylesterase family protein, partial [Rikenellaceae bacterium]
MKIKFLYLIILFLGLSNIASAAEEQVIVYKNTPEADLTMTILRPDLKKKSRKGTPAILYFFGGGFRGGALDQFRPQAEMLRDKGMIAIMVEYRVKLRHNVLPNKGIEDARTAIRYVRANAKELGIDPN